MECLFKQKQKEESEQFKLKRNKIKTGKQKCSCLGKGEEGGQTYFIFSFLLHFFGREGALFSVETLFIQCFALGS